LLERLGAEITFGEEGREFRVGNEQLIEILSLALMSTTVEMGVLKEVQDQVYPGVWASEVPGKAKTALPTIIKVKQETKPVRVKQYPLSLDYRKGIQPIIERFVKHGLLTECRSEYNTPILRVKKADGKYRTVQDLRAINRITEDLYPVVANPYTLLTKLKPKLAWFTILDLKDALFCLPLSPESQLLFAFE